MDDGAPGIFICATVRANVPQDTAPADLSANQVAMGRELFAMFRQNVSVAEEGATTFALPPLVANLKQEGVMLPHADAAPFSDEDTVIRETR